MLNTHSYFSFKYGLLSIPQLIEWGERHHYKTLAITDINSTAGCLDFVRRAQKAGIKPIVGIDFRNGTSQQFIGIAKKNEGYYQLNSLLSQHLHSQTNIPAEISNISDCYILYPTHNIPDRPLHN